jgi:hypothetical protein
LASPRVNRAARAAAPDVAAAAAAPTPDDFRANGAQADRSAEIYGPSPVAQSTLTVHGGEREGRPRVSDSLTTPIVQVRKEKGGSVCFFCRRLALHCAPWVTPQPWDGTWVGARGGRRWWSEA